MPYPVIAGTEEQRDEIFPDMSDASVFPDSGEWVRCPHCGSENAIMIWWEKSDIDFHCGDCDGNDGIR